MIWVDCRYRAIQGDPEFAGFQFALADISRFRTEKGSPVDIRNTSAWPRDTYRTGYLASQVGALDNQTRMARILVEVPDPLAQDTAAGKPELIIGTFVETLVEGNDISNVVRLNRDYLCEIINVWVMDGRKTQH